jgi:acetyl esterase/lipase
MLTLRSLLLTLGTILTTLGSAAEPITVKLWPDGTPNPMAPVSDATSNLIKSYGPTGPNRITDVLDPTLTIFRPESPNGTTVLVAPGGGYMFLSWLTEGTQVCEWLNSIGVTAALLKYRTPTRDEKEMHTMPVEDAQRAIGILRHNAAEWGINPERIGILGFSAGANLAGHVAWDRTPRTFAQYDKLDDQRPPDFLVFVYGGGFLDREDKSKFRVGFKVPQDAPPAFFVVAHDDRSNPLEAAMLYLEYKKLNLHAELHIFTKGGHGFGMRKENKPINEWPQRCGEWMDSMGFLKPSAPPKAGDSDPASPKAPSSLSTPSVSRPSEPTN